MAVFRRSRRLDARPLTAATLMIALAALAPIFNSPTLAQSAQSATTDCAAPLSGPVSGPVTISAQSTPYGRALTVGSGDQAGCSLYLLSSDRVHTLTSFIGMGLGAVSSAPFACSDNPNPTGAPCDTVLWPALLTNGAPIAGPGVNPTLLGTVTRTDFPFGGPVQQVTYAGLPLYRFFLDETPGEREGANLFDPVTTPTGIWYLVDPSKGLPAPGQPQMRLETAALGVAYTSAVVASSPAPGPDETVLAVSMNDNFSLFADASFPVYTLSSDHGHTSACQGLCALRWPPVLTAGRPQAGPNINPHALGTIARADGSRQITFNGQPLYLDAADAYIPGTPGIPGTASINGTGVTTPWGTFNTILGLAGSDGAVG